MKGTTHFKQTIQSYLTKRAEEDSLFAHSFHKENKNIDDCITYILNQVQKSGCNGFADDEIYSMAVHYYDEDHIEIGAKVNSAHIVVNHVVELTEEEKAEARQEAIKQYQKEEFTKIQKRNERPKKTESANTQLQPSLFDF